MERRIQTGGSYLSASEQVATFGLGSAPKVDSMKVEWPSGHVDRFQSVSGGRTIRIIEGSSVTEEIS